MLGKGGGRLRLCVLPDCAQNPSEATRKVGVALCGGGAVALMGGTTPRAKEIQDVVPVEGEARLVRWAGAPGAPPDDGRLDSDSGRCKCGICWAPLVGWPWSRLSKLNAGRGLWARGGQ